MTRKQRGDQSGQALAEYALIIALVVLIGIALLPNVGNKIKEQFGKVEQAFDNQ